MKSNLNLLYSALDEILDPEITRLIEEIAKPDASSDDYVKLPDSRDVDLGPLEVSKLIAKTSNKYLKACRLASLARARLKIAEAAYKWKVKVNLNNNEKNQAAREAVALAAAEEEHEQWVFAQSIVEICESFENNCRIASESARRMLLGAEQMRRADNRATEHSGSLEDKDFTQW